MADVILYGLAPSSYTRTARLALEEKGVSYDLEPVDLKSPALKAIHPFGKMPALRHGDVHLFETIAIARYVDATFQGPALEPKETMARVETVQYVSIACDYLYGSAIRRFVLPHIFPTGPDGTPDITVIEPGRKETVAHLGILDEMVGRTGGTYLVGDNFGLADMFLAPILFWIDKMPGGDAILAGVPRLRTRYEAAAKRPSFAATLPQMPQAA